MRNVFRRKGGSSGNARASSRESRELASFSDVAGLGGDSAIAGSAGGLVSIEDQQQQINSYVRVERLDCREWTIY